jgi:hypothetical protein
MSLEHSPARNKVHKARTRVPPDPLPLLLRYSEVAHLLGISERHVHNLANAGIIQRTSFGNRCVRIVTASVLKLIEEREAQTTAAAS